VSYLEWREEELESRYEATFAVRRVIVLQVTLALGSLAGGWKLVGLPAAGDPRRGSRFRQAAAALPPGRAFSNAARVSALMVSSSSIRRR
jgi:hypothetical protein